MSSFDQEIAAIVAALPDDVLAARIIESRSVINGADGLQSFAAGLLLPLLEAEQQRRATA